MPLAPLLFVLFLGLQLCEVIDWPWIWVFAPLWIPFALFIVFASVMLIFAGMFGRAAGVSATQRFRR